MRLIDADALNKKLCETTIFIKGGEMFQRMINDAPTIEPDGDLISRRAAIEAIEKLMKIHFDRVVVLNKAKDAVNELPSAETPTASEKHQLSADTSTNTPTDLISRQDAIERIDEYINEYKYNQIKCVAMKEARAVLELLPSAPDSRQRGEWARLEREENMYDLHGVPTWGVNYMCDKCGFITTAIQDHFGQYRWCPSCGADMRGGEDE